MLCFNPLSALVNPILQSIRIMIPCSLAWVILTSIQCCFWISSWWGGHLPEHWWCRRGVFSGPSEPQLLGWGQQRHPRIGPEADRTSWSVAPVTCHSGSSLVEIWVLQHQESHVSDNILQQDKWSNHCGHQGKMPPIDQCIKFMNLTWLRKPCLLNLIFVFRFV